MSKKIDDKLARSQRLQPLADLLKFVLTLDDKEIIKAAIESVIESIEDEITK